MNNLFSTSHLNALYEQFVLFLPRIGGALLIFLFFFLLYVFTRRALKKILIKAGFDEALIQILVGSLYKVTLIIIAIIMAAGQLGINVSAALAGLGVIGLAISFAAQDSFSNIISGFIIFFDKPFRVGDWITVGDDYGKVELVTMRSTRIRTRKNMYVVIPNQKIVNEVLTDHSTNGEVRLDIPIGIAYKESIDEARTVLLESVKNIEGIDKEPRADVVVQSLGDSSVNLLLRIWIHNADDETPIFYRAVEAAKKALDKAGIQIPYPHRQLFIDTVEDRVIEKIKDFK